MSRSTSVTPAAAPSPVQDLQQTLEQTEQEVVEGKIDTIDTEARYLGYLGRLRPVLIASTRYLAYSSDVGESFRPVVNPRVVQSAYGISWLYVGGDVAYEGYKAKLRAQEYCPEALSQVVGLTTAKRAIFQATASMLLPSLTIHSIVKYSAMYIKKRGIQNVRVRQWLPSALGLGFIPALPFLFDEPVEHVVDATFDRVHRSLYPDENSPVLRALNEHHGAHQEPKVVEGVDKKI
ncbi:mitochondrial fission process 1 family protein [Sporobolomyces koalae]|uniref:mitochondrial fission process 1 family protein n=1 Tax=Sporobolomyces koalae TaxID=500713 RepID=UPI00317E6ABD